MPRHFNTAGPCNPKDHYMLPPERRLPGIGRLLDEKSYFVVHAPRQVGKTTLFRTLAQRLNEEQRYAAVLASCEVAQAAGGDVERGIAAVLASLRLAASLQIPEALRPPPPDPAEPAENRLQLLLTRWAQGSPKPIVLFLDEIDSLVDAVLISVLRQLRSGYPERPAQFPLSVALIGLRDVRDYRLEVRPDERTLGTASPFNIKVESITLPNFTAPEVAELYAQHTAETGQNFTPEATALAFEVTGGQPWLVNALARQAVNEVVPDRALSIEARHVERAKELLIQRRDTHLDSLLKRLREVRVRRILEPILAGEILTPEVLQDDVQFVQDLGLVVAGPQGLAIANPIYREIIPRALTEVLELSIVPARPSYVGADGRLRFDQLLDDFVGFWRQHAEAFLDQAPYSEAAAELVFMAYLHKIVNGGGFLDREYAVGRGRIDVTVRWPHPGGVERFVIELKVWRDGRADPLAGGLDQLAGYLERLGLDSGTLVIFDRRKAAPPLPERLARQEIEHRGKRIDLLRL
jgi:hypothetical protein